MERTILRLKDAASSSNERLEKLLAGEQKRHIRTQPWFWLGMARKLATAAVFVIAGSVLLTTFNYLRYDSQRQRCQMQQSGFFRGLGNYVADHDGKQPALATQAGAPWYKLGDQGTEDHSNTRRLYILAKNGYVEPDTFVCPSCDKSRGRPQLTEPEIQRLRDFPDRRYITFSFQISCRQSTDGELHCRKVLMADLSPLFEDLPNDFREPFRLRLNRRLLTVNSINHRRKGQNILFGDGHVKFLSNRFIGVANDDVFTLQNTDVYRGYEVPACETDFFLAP
jgi:prepilin-type processing-associated H-X9-DG protein